MNRNDTKKYLTDLKIDHLMNNLLVDLFLCNNVLCLFTLRVLHCKILMECAVDALIHSIFVANISLGFLIKNKHDCNSIELQNKRLLIQFKI